MKVKRLLENAKLPTLGSDYAAGYDLYSTETTTLEPKHNVSCLRQVFLWKFKKDIMEGIPLIRRSVKWNMGAYKKGIDTLRWSN